MDTKAEAEKQHQDAEGDKAIQEDAARERLLVKRRFLGAGIVFCATLLLWQFGSTFPPDFDKPPATAQRSVETEEWVAPQPIDAPAQDAADAVDAPEEEEDNRFTDNIIITEDTASDDLAVTAAAVQPQESPVLSATDAPEPSAKKPSPTAPPVRWQIASFKKEKNARHLLSQLDTISLDAVIEQKNEFFRVVVLLTDEAERAALVPAVEKLLQKKITPAAKQPPLDDSRFVVQVGAFSQQKRVRTIVQKLEKEKFKVQVQPTVRNNINISRIRVTGFGSREAAETARLALVALGYESATVIDLK